MRNLNKTLVALCTAAVMAAPVSAHAATTETGSQNVVVSFVVRILDAIPGVDFDSASTTPDVRYCDADAELSEDDLSVGDHFKTSYPAIKGTQPGLPISGVGPDRKVTAVTPYANGLELTFEKTLGDEFFVLTSIDHK